MNALTSDRGGSVNGLGSQIRQFFYADEVPYGLALVRLLLPLALLCAMVPRWPHARELYSTDGATAPLWITYGYAEMLPELSGTAVVGLFSALVLLLLTSALGWCTRLSLAASAVLYTYFNLLDSTGTMTKYSVIGSHGLLLLSLSNCGAIWSVDSWLRGGRRNADGWPGEPRLRQPRCPAWPRRLLQLLIGAVYFGAAVTKMQTPAFFSGHQLQTWMITNVNFDNPVGEYLTLYPALLVVFAYVTIVWEMIFVFLAWRGWGRRIMLTAGLLFHLMTTLTLGLFIFPLVCLAIYFAFLTEDDVRQLARAVRRRARRWRFGTRGPAGPSVLPSLRARPATSRAAFAILLVAVAAGGIGVEHRMDPYGIRRPEGPYTLNELDPSYVREVLNSPQRLRPIDKFTSFEVGTLLVGDVLANRRRVFRQGDCLIAQCSLTPLHEDMWLECNLHDAQGRIVDRNGQVVSREMLRANFYYTLSGAIRPGKYFLVLKGRDGELMRRPIIVEAGSGAQAQRPLAN